MWDVDEKVGSKGQMDGWLINATSVEEAHRRTSCDTVQHRKKRKKAKGCLFCGLACT